MIIYVLIYFWCGAGPVVYNQESPIHRLCVGPNSPGGVQYFISIGDLFS